MPRRGRLHIPGGIYHVIGRGLERRFIFEDVDDKEDFLSRLGENLSACQVQCLAWALMSNHYHFLLRVGCQPLSKLMAPVLGGFAGYYNRRHGRSGYVFQNRFQSILVDAESYLLELVRYIHLNPLRAGIVESLGELESYRWTGHAGILSGSAREWHQVDEVLKLFGSSTRAAEKSYRQFLAEADKHQTHLSLSGGGVIRSAGGWESWKKARREHRICIGDERILGDFRFVEEVLKLDELDLDTQLKLQRSGWDLERLIKETCRMFNVERSALRQKVRSEDISRVKSLVCFWGYERLDLTVLEIARVLGMTGPAVSYRINKGREVCEVTGISFEDILR